MLWRSSSTNRCCSKAPTFLLPTPRPKSCKKFELGSSCPTRDLKETRGFSVSQYPAGSLGTVVGNHGENVDWDSGERRCRDRRQPGHPGFGWFDAVQHGAGASAHGTGRRAVPHGGDRYRDGGHIWPLDRKSVV